MVDDSDYSGDDDVSTALYIIFIVKVTCSLVTLYALYKYKIMFYVRSRKLKIYRYILYYGHFTILAQ